ncbi:DsbA family oxidoreductase [Sphingomonas pokkalii]|uniref:DSBA-like thioredoxin domain-containing protein n=1 Tax=Sphingomonas pokkalii TaxID=2175090 RepID=A0A2U0SGV2_9SPHN|nr:DsbA family oxidoreductase [Sphingomonas pokkalii]PVX30590.1 hypothetical protein DD559_15610 [Sphingomonas pokkalii]
MGIEAHSPTLTVVSDTICPWCFVGKRKLEAALQILADRGLAIDVEWRPYQLNPDMPDKGMDRREYRAAKFGSIVTSDEMDARVKAAGVELLFRAYFIEGRDIGREEVLREIAFAAGFDHGPSVSAELWELVEQEAMDARRSGVRAVPTFLLDDHLLFAGAQPVQAIALALLRAAESRDPSRIAAAR